MKEFMKIVLGTVVGLFLTFMIEFIDSCNFFFEVHKIIPSNHVYEDYLQIGAGQSYHSYALKTRFLLCHPA